MEDVRFFVFLTVLLLVLCGCASTVSTGRSVETVPSDPWTTVETADIRGLAPPTPDVTLTPEPLANEKELELEQALARDGWARNHELERWIENGMKNPNPVRDSLKVQRLAEQYHLNNATAKTDIPKPIDEDATTGLISTWRWLHRDLEKLQTNHAPAEPYLNDAKFRNKTFDVLRANAAILLGRDGSESAKNDLFAAIKNEELRPEIRCAAVETLAKYPSTTAEDLIPLLDWARERSTETLNDRTGLSEKKFHPGNRALWMELLTAIAEKVGPWESPCFTEPLTARSGDVRLETARIWRRNPPKDVTISLPPEFLKFADDEHDLQVRVEILRTLGAWKQPDILPLIRNDLNRVVQVRSAALDAIAVTDCREAIPLVREKLRDPSAKDRAKAVETLRKLGELDDVFRQGDDKDWEVCVEVAKALTERRTPESIALAKKYLTGFPKVQAATLEAIATWPLEESGPLLLEAMKGQERVQAQKILAAQWDAAAEFNVRDLPKNQASNHADLVRRFHDFMATRGTTIEQADEPKFSHRPENRPESEPLVADIRKTLEELCDLSVASSRRRELEAKLTSLGPRLIPILERLCFEEHRRIPNSLDTSVLAAVDPVFAAIVKLNDTDANIRRRGVGDLSRLAEGVPLGRLAIARIFETARRSDDPFVTGPLLRILEKSDAELARATARTLTASNSAEVRKKAFDVLKKLGEGQDLSLLAEQLENANDTSVRIIFEAITQIVARTETDEFRTEKKRIADELRAMLPQLDSFPQADAAATLHYLGDPIGAEILQRLSLSKDAKLQTYVAKTLGNLNDPVFVPILIRLLKVDNGGVRQAALESLPKLVGEDIGNIETPETRSGDLTPTQKRVLRWEHWARNSR